AVALSADDVWQARQGGEPSAGRPQRSRVRVSRAPRRVGLLDRDPPRAIVPCSRRARATARAAGGEDLRIPPRGRRIGPPAHPHTGRAAAAEPPCRSAGRRGTRGKCVTRMSAIGFVLGSAVASIGGAAAWLLVCPLGDPLAASWATRGFLAMALPGVAGGAFLAREHGRAGSRFVIA